MSEATSKSDRSSNTAETDLLERLGLDASPTSRDLSLVQLRDLRLACCEQRIANLRSKLRNASSDPKLTQNGAIIHGVRALSDGARDCQAWLRAEHAPGSTVRSEHKLANDLQQTVDNLFAHGTLGQPNDSISEASRQLLLAIRADAELAVNGLLHPEQIDAAELLAIMASQAADDEAPGSTSAHDPGTTTVSRRTPANLPPTVRSQRSSSQPPPAPPHPAVHADVPDDPTEVEIAPEPGEETLNLRRLGAQEQPDGAIRRQRVQPLEHPPTAEEQAEAERRLRPRSLGKKVLVRVACGVAIVIMLGAIGWIARGLFAPRAEAPAGKPAGIFVDIDHGVLAGIALELPDAYATIRDASQKRLMLGQALVSAFLASADAPKEHQALRMRIVDAFVAVSGAPWKPEQPPIGMDACKTEALRLTDVALATATPFPMEEIRAAAQRLYPYYEIGQRVQVTYQLNPLRVAQHEGEYRGVHGDVVLIGSQRIAISSIIVHDRNDLLRFDAARAQAARDAYIKQKQAEYAQAISGRRDELLVVHLQEQVDIAKRINEENGYIDYRGSWFTVPQLIDALLLEQKDAGG